MEKRLNIYFPDDIYEALEALAKEHGLRVSPMVRQLLMTHPAIKKDK